MTLTSLWNKILNIKTVEELAALAQEGPEEPEIPSDMPQPVAAAYFLLFEDGGIQFVPEWKEINTETAKTYAKFLSVIVSEGAEQDVCKQLIAYVKNTPISPSFVQRIVKEFKSIRRREKDQPLVLPRMALKIGNPNRTVENQEEE